MLRPLEAIFLSTNIIIFELIKNIIDNNLLTKFHEDWTKNVASRVLTRKNAPHLFHDDRKINVTSRVLTRKIAPPPWWQYIIGINLLTEFHEDRTINVASRVKNASPHGGHVFQANVTIFELIQDIIKTNLLTIFHQDWKINVASRVLTRKNAPPPGGHVFKLTGIIFEFIQDIIGTNHLSKCHKDRKINVNSRVLTRFYYSHIRKNAPPSGGHVCQPTGIIFELVQDITAMNLLTKFHEDQAKNVVSRELTRFYYSHIKKNSPPPGGHVFQPTSIIFKLVQNIIRMHLLTKFHEDKTINVASRAHVFRANVTIFKLIQDIIEINLLTKFHEDWTINVAYGELTSQMLTPHNARRTTDDGQKAFTKAHHELVVLR
ncbi:hypothetical protein DPMN_009288 [Dreissena polymorpha]|uniref:Uncharacterized protein n=1 Tax=Dreissena polymorpha TaxID=45954 RepID=A0A9D4N003_DREPO|nr:hypothetical protein DPMN_009288 [Dreissena polymorpha]